MNGNYFEYVLSGPSYSRITYPEFTSDPDLIEWTHGVLNKLNTATEHKFSFLYNAWTEKDFGESLKEYKKSTNALYADSGGLQIVTRGLAATTDIKRDVYKNQMQYADFGMSFDEIPVSIDGDKSTRLDTSNRYFDKAKFEFCARETGRNIDKQIETFLEGKSDTKPIAIIQGNCYETYMRWCEYMVEEISPNRRDVIGGIAMGAASFGHGFLEDIERAYYFTQLPFKTADSHVHFLAVGSIERILPAVIFAQTGVYRDTRISYDSTSHASGLLFGRMYVQKHLGGVHQFTRDYDRLTYRRLHDLIKSEFDIGDFSTDDLHYFMNTASKKVIAERGDRTGQLKSFVAGTMFAVLSFMRDLDLMVNSGQLEVLRAIKSKKDIVFSSLYEIKNHDDFNHWKRHFAKYVPSERIADQLQIVNTLDF